MNQPHKKYLKEDTKKRTNKRSETIYELHILINDFSTTTKKNGSTS